MIAAPALPTPLRAQAPALATATGLASFYHARLDGARTASGERLDNEALVAAHPTWAFGTMVRVTNLENGKAVVVRVVDRGPARGPRAEGVVIDLTQRAARELDFVQAGRVTVRLEVLRWGSGETR